MHVGEDRIIDDAPPLIAGLSGLFCKILYNVYKMRTVMKQTVFAGSLVFGAVYAETGIKFGSHALYLPYFSDIRCRGVIVGCESALMVDENRNTGFFCGIGDCNTLLHRERDGFFKYYQLRTASERSKHCLVMRVFIYRDHHDVRRTCGKHICTCAVYRGFRIETVPVVKTCRIGVARGNEPYPSVLKKRHGVRCRLFAFSVEPE